MTNVKFFAFGTFVAITSLSGAAIAATSFQPSAVLKSQSAAESIVENMEAGPARDEAVRRVLGRQGKVAPVEALTTVDEPVRTDDQIRRKSRGSGRKPPVLDPSVSDSDLQASEALERFCEHFLAVNDIQGYNDCMMRGASIGGTTIAQYVFIPPNGSAPTHTRGSSSRAAYEDSVCLTHRTVDGNCFLGDIPRFGDSPTMEGLEGDPVITQGSGTR